MFTQQLRYGKAYPALGAAAERGQRVGSITLHIQQTFGMGQQALAGFGEGYGVGVAVEQLAGGVVFQGLYRAGYRTGRAPQCTCGGHEAALVGHADERLDFPQHVQCHCLLLVAVFAIWHFNTCAAL